MNKIKGLAHAAVQIQKPRHGILVLNALYCVHQPNLAFKWDVHASHGRPLTFALGFVKFRFSLVTVVACHLEHRPVIYQHR